MFINHENCEMGFLLFSTNLLKENNNANGRRNGDRFLENYVCQ